MDGKVSKPGHTQSGVSENLPHAQLVAASFDRRGVVVGDFEPSRGVGGGNGRTVAEGENSVHVLAANRLQHGVGSHFRILEMYCNSPVAPGVFELMTAIRDVDELHAQFERGFFKTPRLVAELRGEEQQSFGWRGHARWASVPDSDK